MLGERTGEIMSLTAAVRGLIVFLLSASVVQMENGWDVTYSFLKICAPTGSTVDMSCTFSYPATINNDENILEGTFWFTSGIDDEYSDVEKNSSFSGHVKKTCYQKKCSLRITDLRKNDTDEYKFRLVTNKDKYYGRPGVALYVTDLKVQVSRPDKALLLECLSSCPDDTSFVWFKNGQILEYETSKYFRQVQDFLNDSYSCALQRYKNLPSPSVYAPNRPSVSGISSADIKSGSSVTLNCSSDANPAANYTWCKINEHQAYQRGPKLSWDSIESSHSGEYRCEAVNVLGKSMSETVTINVQYAPNRPMVSGISSADIKSGSSVTLNCSSDANPAANYTWYKRNDKLQFYQTGPKLSWDSIESSHSGKYRCEAVNVLGKSMSETVTINVQYAPKPPSVSASPSAEIVEGSSVNLTCSSDANPAAKYTWYKENKDSPLGPGQIFNITNVRANDSGKYSCEAKNNMGSHNSSLHLTVVTAGVKLPIVAGSVAVVLLVIVAISILLWIRNKRASKEPSHSAGRRDDRHQRPHSEREPAHEKQSSNFIHHPDQEEPEDELQYASVQFSQNQTDLYCNVRPAQPIRHTEKQDVSEYAAVRFTGDATRTRRQEEDIELYSTVNKH